MESHSLILSCNHKILKIGLDMVTHIVVNDYLLTVFCLDGSSHSCCSSLKKVEKKLPETFFKINRNCLANVNLIQSIPPKEREIVMENNVRLKVAKSKWATLKKEFRQPDSPDNGIRDTH
ncbi:MAG: LytTR family DNA-binding domain-containing protein [Cyclobacterium sp.]|uniref:LytTR family DNA-binding domain-containing protein n=1 Tax=unclassified Cyclobacterium TaxID=2615055 RepID=UPI0021D004F7|nr:LytTR family DNA-binding domain-containing protein [Cyclobacterium sp. SYSU L10401]